MEKNRKTIWVMMNAKGEFIRAYETRENALADMKAWRNNMAESGLFPKVSEISTVWCDEISFKVTMRDGQVKKNVARETIIY